MNITLSVFSPQQWKVLRALDQYRYLNTSQMVRLGISKSEKSLRDNALFPLRAKGFVHSEKIGSFLPDAHHLTEDGLKKIREVETGNTIAAPSKKKVPFSALFAAHRYAQVDFQIELNQWAKTRGDVEVLLELQDFIREAKTGKKHQRPSTQLSVPDIPNPVIPDGTFAIVLHSGKLAVYIVEVHRSTQTKAVAEQLQNYFEVIKSGVIQSKYGYQVHPIICSVHHQASVLKGTKVRLNIHPEFEPFKRNFVFHSLDDLTTNFSGGWHFADDTPALPFPNLAHNERQ